MDGTDDKWVVDGEVEQAQIHDRLLEKRECHLSTLLNFSFFFFITVISDTDETNSMSLPQRLIAASD